MSEEQLKAFLAKAQADTSLQEQLKVEGADPVAIAKAAGFTIKPQDLYLAASKLSDEELEAVAGGGTEQVTLTVPLSPAIIIGVTAAVK